MKDFENSRIKFVCSKMNSFLSHAITKFPTGIRGAFAYGSGVFQQSNNNLAKDNMIDLIFIVDNPALWHKENLETHPGHYSMIKNLGSNFLQKLQCNYGAAVYFNTLVDFEGKLIKYGIISLDDLLDDLRNWKTLYISGRLHKPVLKCEGFSKEPLKYYYNNNLESAVNASLLMLPENFREIDLYLTITSLSYLGDFRMIFGEDKNKISNIVLPNEEGFRMLYRHILTTSKNVVLKNSSCIQDISATGKLKLLKSLPSELQRRFTSKGRINMLDESDRKCKLILEDSRKCEILVKRSIGSIVRTSSITQSLKGVMTAGFSKSMFYSVTKVRKMLRSMMK